MALTVKSETQRLRKSLNCQSFQTGMKILNRTWPWDLTKWARQHKELYYGTDCHSYSVLVSSNKSCIACCKNSVTWIAIFTQFCNTLTPQPLIGQLSNPLIGHFWPHLTLSEKSRFIYPNRWASEEGANFLQTAAKVLILLHTHFYCHPLQNSCEWVDCKGWQTCWIGIWVVLEVLSSSYSIPNSMSTPSPNIW